MLDRDGEADPSLYESRPDHPLPELSEVCEAAEFYVEHCQDEDFHPEYHALLTDQTTHRSSEFLRELKTLLDTFPMAELRTPETQASFAKDIAEICGNHYPS